jgi:dienelactone hydrolase
VFHVKQFAQIAASLALLSGAAFAATNPERVAFESLDENADTPKATKLTGYLFRPDGSGGGKSGPHPAVVLAHGCSGLVNERGELRAGPRFWADHFAAKGWVVLAVDSFNPRGHKEVCTQKDRPILESRERPRDAYGALKYLSQQTFVQADKVLLMGFSNGATGSLYAVEENGKPAQLAKDAKIAFKAAISLYPGCTSAEKRGLTPVVPLGIFIGELDDWTPAAPCKALIENSKTLGKPAEIKLYANAYHGFDVPDSPVRVRRDVRMRASPNLEKGVHVGGNDAARAAVVKDVDAFVEKYMAASTQNGLPNK